MKTTQASKVGQPSGTGFTRRPHRTTGSTRSTTMMKKLVLAVAAIMTLGTGAAFAAGGGEGGTQVQAQWDHAMGEQSPVEQLYYGYGRMPAEQAQQQTQAQQQASIPLSGTGWNSNG